MEQKKDIPVATPKTPQNGNFAQARALLHNQPETRASMQPPNDAANVQNQAVKLTSDVAKALLTKDLANLAKKVKDGKPLSSSERNMLQAYLDGGKSSGQEYVDNVVELAEVLGVTRRTVSRWKQIEDNPGTQADGRYHVPAWREFKRQRHGDDSDAEDIDPKYERARNVLLQNEHLEVKIAVMRRNWMPVSEMERIGGELGAAIRKVVSTIHQAAPNVVGVSVAEAEARLKEIEDEILQQLHLIDEAKQDWENTQEDSVELQK